MAINALFYENKVPSGTGVLEIVAEKTKETNPGSRLFVPLQKSTLTGTFHGPLGSLTLGQTFRFSHEVISTPIEAIYRFPLPRDAAVSEVVVTFGDEVIRTKLMERAAAERTYDKAFESGKRAVLVTRESPDVFTLHLTGVPPDTDVTVQASFTLLARSVTKGWEIRVPFTIAPRYVRGDEKHPATQANPLLNAADPGYRISMDLWFRPAVQVTRIKPSADVVQVPGATRITFQDAMPDRDLVLGWNMTEEKEMLTAWSTDDPTSGHRYLLSLINPPKTATKNTVPREMVLVIDQSGSMSGEKWKAAQSSLFALLDTLKEGEYFNICIFSDSPVWSGKPVLATPGTIRAAKEFVTRTSLFSGTELGVALEQAIRQPKQAGSFSRHIVVITDGQVTDEARILKLSGIEKDMAQPRRISVITIDSSPNSYLASEMSRVGGGIAKFLDEQEQVREVLEELLLFWQQPLCSDAVLVSNGQDLDVPGYRVIRDTGSPAIDIGDIRPGSPLFLCGRIGLSETATTLTLKSKQSGTIGTATAVPGDGNLSSALKVLFGAAKIQALEFIRQSVRDAGEMQKSLEALGYKSVGSGAAATLYPENQANAMKEILDQLIISESLRYGIPSTLTSFIGVSERKGIVPEVTVAVPNAMPAGWGESRCDVMKACAPSMECIEETPCMAFEQYPPAAIPEDRILRDISFMDSAPKYSNVKMARRSPQPKPHGIKQGIRVIKGEATLFDKHAVVAGTTMISLLLHGTADLEGVQIRIFLDGNVIGTWNVADLFIGSGLFRLEIMVPTGGVLKGVLLDPRGNWDQKQVTVDIIPAAAW